MTRVSVPSQRSETNQVVPRTVMTLLLARVRKLAVAIVAPQRARRAPARDRGGAGAAGRAGGQRPAQHELGHAVAAGGLAHLEEAAVEGAGLGGPAGQGGLQLHAAGARIDDRADRNRGAVGERRRVGGARHAHEDAAVRRRDGHAAPRGRAAAAGAGASSVPGSGDGAAGVGKRRCRTPAPSRRAS